MRSLQDLLAYGPLYEVARQTIESDTPLDAAKMWRFWTKPRSRGFLWLAENLPLADARRVISGTSRSENERGIVDHYDISNEFFELILDKEFGFYSCADFQSDTDTLEEAQRRTVGFLLRLIDPRPGEQILDLGCGWGAMMNQVFRVTGDRERLTGYTLAQAQVDYIRDRYGLIARVENYATREYRENSFDKIYSIGSWEHIRPEHIEPLLGKLFKALKPGGRLVQQFSCMTRDRIPATFLLGQLIFPGFMLRTHRFQIDAAKKAGFRLTHDTIHDYRPSWKAWYDNLAASREEAIRLVGVREYNRYLMLFALAWKFIDEGYAQVHRLVLEKPVDPHSGKSPEI